MDFSEKHTTGISLIKNGKKLGPCQFDDVRMHLESGLINADDLGWIDDPSTAA